MEVGAFCTCVAQIVVTLAFYAAYRHQGHESPHNHPSTQVRKPHGTALITGSYGGPAPNSSRFTLPRAAT